MRVPTAQTIHVVLRSYEHALPAEQSIAAVLFFDRLCADADAAATGTGWDETGAGAVLKSFPKTLISPLSQAEVSADIPREDGNIS